MTNALYYGDNLTVLRDSIKDESVDLIYLDPPFNSQATYNILFKSPSGIGSQAQIEAFEDTWHWGPDAEKAYDQVIYSGNTNAAEMVRALRSFLGENDMMAYIANMAVRLLELHRVLRSTGSIYLHCDPTASHYLKIVMDAIFGTENYRAEIIWKRTNARGTKGRWPRLHDTILFYSKSEHYTFRSLKVKADKAKLPHTLVTGPDGLKYQSYELTGPGRTKSGESGMPWRGFDPDAMGRHWGDNAATMNAWDAAGLIHWPKDGGFPRRRDAEPFDPDKRETVVGSVWTDIDRINQTAKERLGYPTQKPLALLERILQASAPAPGLIVLDPFCGCGTAIHAAHRMGCHWIGIDLTHLAISLIERRLKDAFPGITFDVFGTPKDIDGARDLAERDKYQFQWWALSLIEAQPYGGKKKGADSGIDGLIYFRVDRTTTDRAIVSVKGGAISVNMVRDLKGVLERERAPIGIFLTLKPPTKPMLTEATAAGFYELGGRQYPRLQIITVEDALAGTTKPAIPLVDSGAAFKRATREESDTQGKLSI